MAYCQRCDGCGKISPDENGLHIANEWVEVKVKNPKIKISFSKNYLYCLSCWLPSEEKETILDKIKRLFK